MKPLTIEELKALQVGDWVWIVDKISNNQGYALVERSKAIGDKGFMSPALNRSYGFGYYDTYGTNWLAYKNKEQAEAEEYKIDFDEHGGWEVSKYIPAHYQPWFTADTKEEAQQRIKELQGENK